MLAWHAEPTLKEYALERLREHRRLDEIVQRQYWAGGRGCHLGCLTHADIDEQPHAQAERLFGIEERVGYWLEAVFEGLPQQECAAWVIDSCEAIPVGADMSRCHHELAVWLFEESGLLAITDVTRDAIKHVASLHRHAAAGEPVPEAVWSAARSAAWSAARSAAWSAAESAAESAVWASARSAASSAAESAAESAARSAAWSVTSATESAASAVWSARSARSESWRAIAAKSLEIFSNAPIPAAQVGVPDDVRDELCD